MKAKALRFVVLLLVLLTTGIRFSFYQTQAVQASDPCEWQPFVSGPLKAVLLAPKGHIYNDTPSFYWQSVPGAVCYLLWVNELSDPNIPGKIRNHYLPGEANCAAGGECSVSPDVSFEPVSAQWWVTTYFADHAPVESNGAFFTVHLEPTPTVTPTATQTSTPPPTITPTPTQLPTDTAESTPTATQTSSMTETSTATATATQTPTTQPTATATTTATATSLPSLAFNCGITIENDAPYTSRTLVRVQPAVIYANAAYTVGMILMNSGGLPGDNWQPFEPAPQHRLEDVGQKVATLTVYAHFRNGFDSCKAHDGILYDPIPPRVNSAQVSNNRMQVTASDSSEQGEGSGLSAIQISTQADFSASAWQPYTTTLTLHEPPGEQLYVRVHDGAGNVSPPVSVLAHVVYLPFVQR